jgi:ribose 5-phosphate isomerase A
VSVEVDRDEIPEEMQLAAEAAAAMVEDGMTIGLGTGTTVAHLLPVLAARRLSLRCIATSPRTEAAAAQLGLRVEAFTQARLDMAIDGADQISPAGWLVKGGGAAHTREKLVAVTAERFVVIADSTKVVPAVHSPVPLELLAYGLESTLARLGNVKRRDVPLSPDGGVIADFTGEVDDPAELAARLDGTPGVVAHGLFPPALTSTILVGRVGFVERRDLPLASLPHPQAQAVPHPPAQAHPQAQGSP